MDNRTIGIIVGGVLLLGVVIAVGITHHGTSPTPESDSASTTPEVPSGVITDTGPNIPAGSKEYSNSTYHMQLYFPNDLTEREYREKGGALTVTFHKQDDSNGGFQIYITPYSDTQITSARFKLDEPSGVMKNQTPIVIDGVSASMFFSTNSIMGDTREVWFIHNGFLYEVTTYKELDVWLAGIMQTWKFI